MNQALLNPLSEKAIILHSAKRGRSPNSVINLSAAEINREYKIKNVVTDDHDIANFLFTLGCFKGEPITVISVLSENYIITVKDARYSIDADLAKVITLA